MVATIPRVLASLVVAAVIMLGVPMPPFSAVLASATTQDVHGTDEGSGAHALASVERAPETISLALPTTSNGELRQLVRDLTDDYALSDTALPEIPGPWGYAPLPESVVDPDLAEPFGLPFGRAPPLTARV
ncbi:hypothetical protein [Halostreptopolyspora alba]|uniref:Uncharacterized protein n=1 Tax=Halostreptopolyspora alba TaxID=2487137 RepID=A0A3N0E4U7_9ACTN|nr:hypothetical protein EFW17_18050 [Nocardiopsaceae bacterium YIM 96095]